MLFRSDVKVPAGEWEPKHRLALEREMLGLYVSGHPLNGLEHALNARADTAITTILEGDVAEGATVTVGGILASVTRRVNKKGEPWASAQIEDLAGGIEVLFFPRTYQAVSIDVAEDAIVLVKGKVNKREDRVSLFVEDLAVPDLTVGGAGGAPVRVSIESARCTPERVGRLKEVLVAHPGPSEVHLTLRAANGASHVLRLDDALKVTNSGALMGDLKALLGPRCLG